MSAVAIYDANALHPSILRNVLTQVGLARLACPKGMDLTFYGSSRNLRSNRSDLDPARLDGTRRLMNEAIGDVMVTVSEPLDAQLKLPDPSGRHILSAAIHAKPQAIVTLSLCDPPPTS